MDALPRNLELYPYNRDVIMYTYHYVTAHFLTNNGVLSIVRSPAPSSALLWVGTSDIYVSQDSTGSFYIGRLLEEIRVWGKPERAPH